MIRIRHCVVGEILPVPVIAIFCDPLIPTIVHDKLEIPDIFKLLVLILPLLYSGLSDVTQMVVDHVDTNSGTMRYSDPDRVKSC